MSDAADVLRSDFDLNFTYTRTYGKVLGRFFTALKNKKIVGIKGSQGQILCPPQEYDPQSFETLSEFVDLGETGEVLTWSWVEEPLEKHLFSKPFAWALIKIDGADTSMLHAVVTSDKSVMRSGMKVKVCWADDRVGSIHDIACFEPV